MKSARKGEINGLFARFSGKVHISVVEVAEGHRVSGGGGKRGTVGKFACSVLHLTPVSQLTLSPITDCTSSLSNGLRFIQPLIY